ncbi:MAG: thioredoxin, partial [Desulfovibrionaceae bacterium]|nr:thioredoxin [Desulfovibrionaceae bacterium]
MEYSLLGLLVLVFLVYLLFEARRRVTHSQKVINEEKRAIADASNMTASIGVFYPDKLTTIIIGASEEMGALYYRMLNGNKVINRTKINLANVVRVEMQINSRPFAVESDSEKPTTSLRSTDIANRKLDMFTPEALQGVQKAS